MFESKEYSFGKYKKTSPIISVVFLLLIIMTIYILFIDKRENSVANTGVVIKNENHTVVPTETVSKKFPELNTLLSNNTPLPQTGKVILADLSLMKISLINEGVVVNEYPILAKGQEGSRYETPFGTYTINYKEKNHKVSVKDIYMPFSAHFFGNFFIHGKPIYSNGKELFDGPSGGCIRLSNDVAEQVYAFAEQKTPVFITEDNGENDIDFMEKISKWGTSSISLPEKIRAKSYVVSDLKTGIVLAGENIKEKMPIYSLTKLMSATVADETFRDDKKIVIDQKIDGEIINESKVKPGDQITVTEILYPIIFEHDDLATYSMATNIGSIYYTQLMNKKAEAIGMNSTNFSDPAGINDQSISTAQDLFILSRYIYFKHPYISKLTLKSNYSLSSNENHTEYSWINKSEPPKTAKLFSQIEKEGLSYSITVMPITILGEERLVSIVILESDSNGDGEILSIVDSVKNIYRKEELVTNTKI